MASPYFNAAYYLRNNPDVLAAGYTLTTAEDHYLRYGANEAFTAHRDGVDLGSARKPAPWFDIGDYLDHYPDLIDNGVVPATALHHFATYGIAEGRSPSPTITLDAANLGAYAAGNPDLMTAFGISNPANLTHDQITALAQHYYQYGYKEDRPDLPVINGFFTYNDPDGAARDYLIGTAYNDTFVAAIENSLQTGDYLDGGGGYNVLNIADGAIANKVGWDDSGTLANNTIPTLKNIQKIVNADVGVNLFATPAALNLKNVTGLQVLETDFSSIAPPDAGGDTGAGHIEYFNATLDTLFVVSNTAAQTKTGIGAGVVAVHTAPGDTSTTLNVLLKDNAPGSYYGVVVMDDNHTHAHIDVAEGNSGLFTAGFLLHDITISGSGDLGLQNWNYTHLTHLDASAASGAMTLGGPDNDRSDWQNSEGWFPELNLGNNFVVKTGSGDDKIDLSTVTTTGYVDAGAGNDTLIVDFNYQPPTFEDDDGEDSETPDPGDAVWTLTGGAGKDTFKIAGFNVYHDDEGFDADTGAIITDFNATDDTVLLNFGLSPTVFVDATVVERVVLNSRDIDEALNKLLGPEHDNAFINGANVAVLEMDNKTYAIYEVGDHNHGVIEFTGTNLGLDDTNVAGF